MQTSFVSWGAILAVTGDAALLTSGWGGSGADVYQLNGIAPPTYEETVCGVTWNQGMFVRQDNTLFLASGECGAQTFALP